MAEGLPLSEMLSRIAEDPKASQMLSQILGGITDTEAEKTPASAPEEPRASDKEEPAGLMSLSLPPALSLGKGRRGVLTALRPYLSQRRCASLDRMIRAMELYEIIIETQKAKGDITHV